MVQGVLQTFRRRLDVKEAVLFANVLPPMLRALFVTVGRHLPALLWYDIIPCFGRNTAFFADLQEKSG